MNAASADILHIWCCEREKKFNKNLLKKFHTNSMISIQACTYQGNNSLLHFSMHYHHSILCVFKFEACMTVFSQTLCQKKDSVQQHDPFLFLSEL